MAQTQDVHNGFFKPWTDFDRHPWSRQITMSETSAGYVSAAIAVLLTLCTPAAYVLVNRLVIRLWAFIGERTATVHQHPDQVVESNEQQPLIPRAHRESYYPVIRETWKGSHAPDVSDSAVQELFRMSKKMLTHRPRRSGDPEGEPAIHPEEPHEIYEGYSRTNLSARKFDILILTMILVFCYATFGLLIWGSIASSNIVSDTIALSASPDCGFWNPDPKAPRKVNGTFGHRHRQQVEAAEYANRCYRAPQGTDGCNYFLAQDIPYTVKENDECPFSDQLCLKGRYSAFTMSTELVSSKTLGINVPKGYLFNRTTTCSPITRGARYVIDEGASFAYNYGPTLGMNGSTWITSNSTQKIFPGYDVATFCYEPDAPLNWKPLPDFHADNFQTTMLLFVQSQKNYHRAPISDSIFPAKRLVDPPLFPGIPLYYNDDQFATALACVDRVSVCTTDKSACWSDISNPDSVNELKPHNEKTGYYMLVLALMNSNVCNTILLRGSSALDAHSKIQYNISFPLALPGSISNDQWKVESRKLFEASLARIQIDLRDYIRGAAANEIGFSTSQWNTAYEDMCGAYKFHTVGWKNVSVGGFWMCVALVLAVYLLSIEVKQSGDSKLIAEVLWDTRLGWHSFREWAAASKSPVVDSNGNSQEAGAQEATTESDSAPGNRINGVHNDDAAENGSVSVAASSVVIVVSPDVEGGSATSA